ncbi:MAG: LVIVD repeat-containing protein, partial [Gammaproteobacteria bacterium]
VRVSRFTFTSLGYARAVAVAGNYAYVTETVLQCEFMDCYPVSGALHVIDISNPASPQRVGGYGIRGSAWDVAVSGKYAYVADDVAGLQIIDVSDPTSCVRVGNCDTSGSAVGVAMSGNCAYIADGYYGLQVFDVSNPTNCVRVSGNDTSGFACGVAVVTDRIYMADGEAGLVVLPTLTNVQFTVRVNATAGAPFTLEAATNHFGPANWTPLLTTNVLAMPFDYVDFDVKPSDKPQKYYRVRQP